MPGPFLRFLAVAFLALAIPAQGLAAVTADLCMATGGHHGQGAMAAHDHGHGAETHSHDAEGDQPASAHCLPCVACCAAAAIAPTLKIQLAEAPAEAAVSLFQSFISGAPPEEFDRPPLAL